MSAAAINPAQAQAKEQALLRIQAIKSELVERISHGRYLSKEQQEWETIPEYLRDMVLLMAGIEGRDSHAAWQSFSVFERTSLMQVVALLKADLAPVVSLALGSARAAQQ